MLALVSEYPAYQKQFERQIRGQHAPTVLEAKLSHDLAYYRYFDSIASLAELAPSLKTRDRRFEKHPDRRDPCGRGRLRSLKSVAPQVISILIGSSSKNRSIVRMKQVIPRPP